MWHFGAALFLPAAEIQTQCKTQTASIKIYYVAVKAMPRPRVVLAPGLSIILELASRASCCVHLLLGLRRVHLLLGVEHKNDPRWS